ncbi:hypothetical protein ALI144C_06950 [Actinosynnema sp. ALI-1.44]|uniref:SMI1/KNR4 family protein n=1 Tax=Actinosynnema sp. ALI-1.44 TaxID=1933779 RepID=UPI00097CB550|nr:SMI1/KNR4 family protein [Actinosynnema sp. ALI-1.44]ONI88189.1 hypothetical protein ALI144C_06950 [Actinosynnema sp. ALI-1.44]
MGIGNGQVGALASVLRSQFGTETVVGLLESEIRDVERDQETPLPAEYVDFLTYMGRRAGKFFVGTDIFYPGILGAKRDAFELFDEFRVERLINDSSLVFAIHQGYQIYWMADTLKIDPPVFMYEEGGGRVVKKWDSFSRFLWEEYTRIMN